MRTSVDFNSVSYIGDTYPRWTLTQSDIGGTYSRWTL